MNIASKATDLLQSGSVVIDEITFGKMTGTVISVDKDGKSNPHSIMVWRDGHYTCTCQNFLYSKSEHVNLWEENVRVKPECKHALAVKFSPEYQRWIRMVIVPTNDGYSLRSIEGMEDIHVKSFDEKISKEKILPKVKVLTPRLIKKKIPFAALFGDLVDE